jgi:hypothetical protein
MVQFGENSINTFIVVIISLNYPILHWLSKKHDELVIDYVKRFRETKNRCYNLVISEKDIADLVSMG